MPVVGLLLLQVFNVLVISWLSVIVAVVALSVIDVIGFTLAIRLFDRENILVRWK